LRVQAMLRREERLGGLDLTPTKLSAGPISVDTAARTAFLDDAELSLTHREFDLLAFLVSHPGKAYTKAELLRRVWGWDFGDSSTVTVHVRRLREKIELDPSDPRLVLTVPRTGYRFAGEAG
jgi:DNA-binding response OmpR family regulator